MTDLAVPGLAYAEFNGVWGSWIVRCPAPWCWNAMLVDLGQPEYRCEGRGACGFEAAVRWPADPMAILTVLAMRPDPRTWNWLPGETVEDLITENVSHGVIPPEWREVDRPTVLTQSADGVVVGGRLLDALPAGRPLLQLQGG